MGVSTRSKGRKRGGTRRPKIESVAQRYGVLAHLGSGGNGDVYRVHDTQEDRDLALKQLRGADASTAAITQFKREYYTLSHLDHPSIVKVYDYGIDRVPYYTMELVEAPDLKARGQLPAAEVARVLYDLASALCVLHARGWLHRDVSPTNVLSEPGGRTTLIDFGAMVPMGLVRHRIGTPPLAPPESLNYQSLDAQSDLYSVGALAYWMLSGRHAYPARSFKELRDAFRSAPPPLSRSVEGVPAELERLVMELLSLERLARPPHASVVMERLTPWLDHPVELQGSGRAYLARPRLVGRESQRTDVRRKMVRALRGRGSAILVEGPRGSGRSRFVDECVLEAKLLGAAVVRADSGDAAAGDYAVIAQLGRQLVRNMPTQCRDAARLRRNLLASVIPELAEPGEPSMLDASELDEEASSASLQRRHYVTALRDWLRTVAKHTRLVIVVDDLDSIDEPSAAVLAALAHRTERRRLVLLVAADVDRHASPGLELLRGIAERVTLDPLTLEETEELLASIFGGAPEAAAVARLTHSLADGNPGAMMNLVEHFVQQELARCSAGSWTLDLPAMTKAAPPSLDAALHGRLDALDARTLELASALALSDPLSLDAEGYARLLPGAPSGEVYRCLDALVSHGILMPQGERYRFSNARWRGLIDGRLDDDRRRALHAVLADAGAHGGDPWWLPRHLFGAGDVAGALQALRRARYSPRARGSLSNLALVRQIVDASKELDLPPRTRLGLEIWLLNMSGPLGDLETFTERLPGVLQALDRASGLADIRALGGELSEAESLTRGLQAAQERQEALPEQAQTYAPVKAIEALARVTFSAVSISASTQDKWLLDQLPSLRPFEALAPPIAVVNLMVDAAHHHHATAYRSARACYLSALARIDEPDGAGMGEGQRRAVRWGLLYGLGLYEAGFGWPTALSRIEELESIPGFRVNAWRVHTLYHLLQGDIDEARRCERRAELLHLQDGGGQVMPNTGLASLARAHWLAEDLASLKQLRAKVGRVSEHLASRRILAQLIESQYLHLRGEHTAALEALQPLIDAIGDKEEYGFLWVTGTHLQVLCALERGAEAVELGRGYLDRARDRGLNDSECSPILRPLALALSRVGRQAEATELCSSLLSALEGDGVRGLLLGLAYEASARVAHLGQDRESALAHSARCRAEWRVHVNATLAVKHQRLVFELQQHDDPENGAASEVPSRRPKAAARTVATVFSRMDECVGLDELAQCALTVLLEEAAGGAGYLFLAHDGDFRCSASTPPGRPPRWLESWLHQLAERALDAEEDTRTTADLEPVPTAPRLPPGEQLPRTELLLTHRDGERILVAVAAIYDAPGVMPRCPAPAVMTALATSLVEHDEPDAF